MSTCEPRPTSPADRIAALRATVEGAARDETVTQAPVFSADGGVTVFGPGARTARLQPLGQRTRISLADGREVVGEGEVDSDTLVRRLAGGGDCHGAVAAALDIENGRTRPVSRGRAPQ